MIQLGWYLAIAAGLFCIGLFGVLTRRSAIGILLGLEFMLNAANINFLALWRAGSMQSMSGAVFSVIIYAVAAAEVAVGLAIILSIYRSRRTLVAADINDLKE